MKYICIALIKFYRRFISPVFPPCCKYYPSCSQYALEAFRKFGFFRGFLLALWRILRCNPWSLGGIDPVPEKFTFRKSPKN
ncbi:MAG TPA: membrane protein insertion efficiency factor YidD [Ruminococcus sp.]|nr:membrane protein insertion efficiency factor YidD [Ruminococcus sp.]